MTLRKWITFASAAAMLASVGACKDTGGGGTKTTSPEGRRSGNGCASQASPGAVPVCGGASS